VLRADGWWRRPSRLIHGPAADASLAARPPAGAPILILGTSGTLGRAFQRICEQRNLRVHATSRSDVDICDPARIDAVLRRLNPWAVINATGYVRVDDAEADRDGCWRDNVIGAVNVAAACRRRRLPLVTFSSDLVFDGSLQRPYLEDDPTQPLNTYGASKAEAERRVLELLPNALVIRTSAFFGPWDNHNFATVALRAIAALQPFKAADDYTVSPTYVPDLVHAALDLLIDGERGIWHLANSGAVTWFDFAQMVAREAGADATFVERCSWRDVWHTAERPGYSALGSSRGVMLRPLEQAVKSYVAEYTTAQSQEAAQCASS
jgi:dTDP-4-dehydrorhamnose reductase